MIKMGVKQQRASTSHVHQRERQTKVRNLFMKTNMGFPGFNEKKKIRVSSTMARNDQKEAVREQMKNLKTFFGGRRTVLTAR